jgi:hypothetical protein
MPVSKSLAVAAAMLAPVFTAGADELVWRNVTDFPAALEKTDAGWSAIRIDGFSLRAAADDFILEETTRITRIEFWTVQLTDNPLLGVDWYIFTSDAKDGPPTKVLAYGASVPTPHEDTGLVNSAFGLPIYLESAEVNQAFEAGHYFLAFRCVHRDDNKGNGALTTNDQIGTSRGWWCFTLDVDGTNGDPWDKMEVFNGQDNEWAFQIWAESGPSCYPDFTGDGVLDLFDFLEFVNQFNAGDDSANCDGEGGLDLFDFLCFTNAFNAGC